MSSYQLVTVQGWIETLSDGVATVNLALLDEGMTTGPDDTPRNAQFKPFIINAETFSIKRSPVVWWEGEGGNEAAAYGALQVYNARGALNFLLEKNLKDTPIVIRLPAAASLMTGTAMQDSFKVATGIIDKISQSNPDTITISMRDTITRLDKVLPTRFNPGFVDTAAANIMKPLSFGGFRNRVPQLINSATREYLLHDGMVPNILKVADKGAPLDPHANPPQYTPTFNGAGIQLQTLPIGLLTVDGSSYGTQAVIPGVDDILAGDGEFLGTWTGSPAVPPNWTFSHITGSSISKLTNPPYGILGTSNGVQIRSKKVWNPGGGTYGDSFYHSVDLQPGVTYRVSFGLYNVQQEAPFFIGGMVGGVMLTTALSAVPSDYITGYGHPIATPNFQSQRFSFEFTIPKGSSRKLYFLFVPSAGNAANTAQGSTVATLFDVKIEQVGQFVDQPFTPMPFANYVTEILVNRGGEDPSIFNAAEAAAIFRRDDGTLMPWGITYDEPPNMLDALRTPAKSPGFVLFTDADGVIRFRRQIDPREPANQANVKCDFTSFNMQRPIVLDDLSDNLTTLFGARPNEHIFGDADFVTDQAIVTQDTKVRFMRQSQFWVTSSYLPSSEYSAAINAPIFDTRFDEKADAQKEVDRVVKMHSPQRYSDGSISSGKRQRLQITAAWDDPNKLGVTIQCAVTSLLYGDIVLLNYDEPEHPYVGVYASVLSWEIFPNANKIVLIVRIAPKEN